jgi:hypothetical protein
LRVFAVTVPDVFDSDQRAAAALPLSDSIPRNIVARVSSMNRDEDPEARASRLAHLTEMLPGNVTNDLKDLMLADVRAITDEQRRADALKSLVHLLREDLKQDLIVLAGEIINAELRAETLVDLFPYLPAQVGDATARLALAAIKAIDFEMSKATALHDLQAALKQRAKRLAQDCQAEALAVVQGINNGKVRAFALSAVVDYLPEDQKDSVIAEALRSMWSIGDDQHRSWGLRDLVANLRDISSVEVLPELLEASRTIREVDRWYVISGLAERLGPILSNRMLSEFLQAVKEMRDPHYVAWSLRALAQHVPGELKLDVFTCADQVPAPAARVEALLELVPARLCTDSA